VGQPAGTCLPSTPPGRTFSLIRNSGWPPIFRVPPPPPPVPLQILTTITCPTTSILLRSIGGAGWSLLLHLCFGGKSQSLSFTWVCQSASQLELVCPV